MSGVGREVESARGLGLGLRVAANSLRAVLQYVRRMGCFKAPLGSFTGKLYWEALLGSFTGKLYWEA